VTGEEFMELYLGSTKLRQYIVDLVKAYTNDIGRRAHLLYTAWIAVSEAKGDGTMEYYYCVIYSALRREWEKKYLENCRYPSDSPAVRRANRRLKSIVVE
jgi:hypothetical protein